MELAGLSLQEMEARLLEFAGLSLQEIQLDCSGETRDERKKRLARLRARRHRLKLRDARSEPCSFTS